MTGARLIALALVLGVACGGRSGAASLAELVEITGQAEASAAAAPAAWTAAAAGHRFARGDGVRTGDASGARVKLRSGGVLRMGANALVRFGPDAGGGQPAQLALEAGEAEIEAGSVELVIDTGGGRTRVGAGGKAHLVPLASGGMRVDVEIGTATVEQAGQPARTLAAGEGADVAPAATRVASPASRDAGTDAPAIGPDGGPPALAVDVPGGSIAVDTPATIVDVDITAGEQATVHDAAPPTQVRLAFAGVCPGEALVELRSGRTRARLRGAGQVVAPLGPGQHRYLIRCLTGDKPAKNAALTGRLQVLADRGEKRIKLTAPKNQVDADGRTWQLLYQNKKPEIEFRWPKPPAADSYSLVIADARGRERKRAAPGGKVTLDSGDVGEGAWRFWFVAADGIRSPVTQLTLAFDNAAPVAQLIEPADAAAWQGGVVRVAGVATEGSSVSVDGTALALDGSLRFDSQVTLAAGRDAVAVRIAQPGRGVHYYVRRRSK